MGHEFLCFINIYVFNILINNEYFKVYFSGCFRMLWVFPW